MIQLGEGSCINSLCIWYPHETGKGDKNISYCNVKQSLGSQEYDMFPIRNGLRQEDALSPLLFNVAL
jgi:hypothetical protein